jgi:hypothetical protein
VTTTPKPVDFRDCIDSINKVGGLANQMAHDAPIKRLPDGRAEVRYQGMANIQAFALAARLQITSIVTTIRPANVLGGLEGDAARVYCEQVFGKWGDWKLAEEALETSALFGFMTLMQFQIETMLKRFAPSTSPHSLRSYVRDVIDPYHPGVTSADVWAPFGVFSGWRNSFHNNGMVDRNPCSWISPSGNELKTVIGQVAQDVDFITVGELAIAILEYVKPLVIDSHITPEYDHNIRATTT